MSQKASGSVHEDEAAQRGKRDGKKKKKKSKTIHLPKPLLPNPTELEDFEVDLKLNLD